MPVKAARRRRPRAPLPHIGWREWVALPELGVERIKAKVDTGARTSALHAFDLEHRQRRGRDVVEFTVLPAQDGRAGAVRAEAELVAERYVSNPGRRELRPVVLVKVRLHGVEWEVEMTLTQRDEMGFRMLLGRQAIRRRFVVDPGRSYLGREDRGTSHDEGESR